MNGYLHAADYSDRRSVLLLLYISVVFLLFPSVNAGCSSDGLGSTSCVPSIKPGVASGAAIGVCVAAVILLLCIMTARRNRIRRAQLAAREHLPYSVQHQPRLLMIAPMQQHHADYQPPAPPYAPAEAPPQYPPPIYSAA